MINVKCSVKKKLKYSSILSNKTIFGKIALFITVFTIFFANFASDEHYKKIIKLYSGIKLGVSSRDKLRTMVEILKETSELPKDTNYKLDEINEVLDIVLDITSKNNSLLRFEYVITSLVNIIGDNLHKDDIREKLIKIATANIVYQPNANYKNYITVYTNLINVLYEKKLYKDFLTILKHMSRRLSRNRLYSKQYYVIFNDFFDKYKSLDNNKDLDRQIELFFIRIACMFHFKNYELASKIFIFYEKKHENNTDSSGMRSRILYILFQAIHYIGISNEAKTQELYDKIVNIKNSATDKKTIEKADKAIERIKLNIKNIAKDKIKLNIKA